LSIVFNNKALIQLDVKGQASGLYSATAQIINSKSSRLQMSGYLESVLLGGIVVIAGYYSAVPGAS
jgi:hypothetical protein